MSETEFPPSNTLPVLIDAGQIQKRVEELAVSYTHLRAHET